MRKIFLQFNKGIEVDIGSEILSDITVYSKYAKYISAIKRRETWDEIVLRTLQMDIKKFPELSDELMEVYSYVFDKKVLTSMRRAQFAGKAIEINPARSFNCSALAMDHYKAFSEIMFLLLGGSGVGIGVQKHQINKLPVLRTPLSKRNYLVSDNIIGWAEAVHMTIKAFMCGNPLPVYDFRDVRDKGARLVTAGGKAPGHGPLKICLENITWVFQKALIERGEGCKLISIEVHDIACFIAEAVLSGGIRRSAMISLFDIDDERMLNAKYGDWWVDNGQRAMANNSAVVVRHKISKHRFKELMKMVEDSNAGEPGLYFVNDKNILTNPCLPYDATVLTPNGMVKFGDIKEGDLIWSASGWTTVVKKWSTGVKPTYKYHTTSGYFYGTDNHRIVQNNTKVEVKDATSIDYLKGALECSEPRLQDVVDGIVLGDGSVHTASNNKVYLCVGDDDYDYFTSNISPFIGTKSGISKYAYDVTTTITHDELPKTFDRRIPERFMSDKNSYRGVLKGLYTANGSVCGNRITYKTASFGMIEDIQVMLNAVGISSYYTTNKPKDVTFGNGEYTCRQSYDLNISTDRNLFVQNIGFVQKYKNDKIDTSKRVSPSRLSSPKITRKEYVSDQEVFDITVDNNTHTFWTRGCNVSNCCEISLTSMQMCNLTEINASNVVDQADFNARCKAAAFLGTIQAAYTDFHYLRDEWKINSEKDALLGVSMTGIASGALDGIDVEEGARIAVEENIRVAKLIGINPAARVTTVKPSGTTSLVVGSSSGIHAWHDKFYIRRMRLNKNEALYDFLVRECPEWIVDDVTRPTTTAIIEIPVKAPEGAVTRSESPFDLLERVKKYRNSWIVPGHYKGDNTHNISVTVSVKPEEWHDIVEWMWHNRDNFNGISLLPFDTGSYQQTPFESITEEEYDQRAKTLRRIDLTQIIEQEDYTDLSGEQACAGGSCEIK